MYVAWMTIVAMVFASGLWLAWEGCRHRGPASAGPLRERAILVIGIVLALAAAGVGAIGYAFVADPESHGLLFPGIAFAAALALGAGAIALFQSAGHLRRARRG